jgi:hypothetical protein
VRGAAAAQGGTVPCAPRRISRASLNYTTTLADDIIPLQGLQPEDTLQASPPAAGFPEHGPNHRLTYSESRKSIFQDVAVE